MRAAERIMSGQPDCPLPNVRRPRNCLLIPSSASIVLFASVGISFAKKNASHALYEIKEERRIGGGRPGEYGRPP